MNDARTSSASATAKTSASAPANAKPENHQPILDEKRFLDRQAQNAQAAINHTVSQLRSALGETVDPRRLTRQFPLASLSVALAMGFAGAWLAVPSKEEQSLKRMEKIRQATNGKKKETEPEKPAAKLDSEASKTGFLAMLAKESISLIRPLLTALLSAGLQARSQHAHEDDGLANDKAGGTTKPIDAVA